MSTRDPSGVVYAWVAFDENPYVEDAALALAELFDVCASVCGIEGRAIADAFLASGLARQFERFNAALVAGKSAVELAELLLESLGRQLPEDIPPAFDASADYWVGWILARYQARTGHPYARILERTGYDQLLDLYSPCHEAPKDKAFEILDARMADPARQTRLKVQREAAGLTQSQLALRSQVGLRSIQMYEQRNKDIGRAQAMTLLRLSRALHCEVEDLLET